MLPLTPTYESRLCTGHGMQDAGICNTPPPPPTLPPKLDASGIRAMWWERHNKLSTQRCRCAAQKSAYPQHSGICAPKLLCVVS